MESWQFFFIYAYIYFRSGGRIRPNARERWSSPECQTSMWLLWWRIRSYRRRSRLPCRDEQLHIWWSGGIHHRSRKNHQSRKRYMNFTNLVYFSMIVYWSRRSSSRRLYMDNLLAQGKYATRSMNQHRQFKYLLKLLIGDLNSTSPTFNPGHPIFLL